MKKILALCFCAIASVCFAESWQENTWVDLNKNSPDEGTPEYVAVSYMRAFNAGDATSVLKLCDERLKKYFAGMDEVPFKKSLEKAKKWDLKRKFEGIKSGSAETPVISFKYFDTRINREVNTSLNLILVDGKYRVTL